MLRSKKATSSAPGFVDITPQLRTAACVPAIREAVKVWREAGYPGITETTRQLFRHWFQTDHRLKNGRPFAYHYFARFAHALSPPRVAAVGLATPQPWTTITRP